MSQDQKPVTFQSPRDSRPKQTLKLHYSKEVAEGISKFKRAKFRPVQASLPKANATVRPVDHLTLTLDLSDDIHLTDMEKLQDAFALLMRLIQLAPVKLQYAHARSKVEMGQLIAVLEPEIVNDEVQQQLQLYLQQLKAIQQQQVEEAKKPIRIRDLTLNQYDCRLVNCEMSS